MDHHPLNFLIFTLFILLALISFSKLSQAEQQDTLIINELMIQPTENDHYFEWIELYNPTHRSINLSGWTLFDGQEEDCIIGDTVHGNGTMVLPSESYALITDKGTKLYETYMVSDDTVKLSVDDYTLCGYGLNNKQEYLQLNNSKTTVDWVEWGYNYPHIPGNPSRSPPKNTSLARSSRATHDSLLSFYHSVMPTPGSQNQLSFNLSLTPKYAAKISQHQDVSPPYTCKLTLTHLLPNTTYHWSAGFYGTPNSSYPASQTWDNTKWKYSRYYNTFTTDSQGVHEQWILLRFHTQYSEYQHFIKNNSVTYLKIKLKQNKNTYQITQKRLLLDLDNTTTNALPAGFLIGTIKSSLHTIQNRPILIRDNHGDITALYFTKENNIQDHYIPQPGYYKLPSPVGTDYTVILLDHTTEHLLETDATIQQGENNVQLTSSHKSKYLPRYIQTHLPLSITNKGNFTDTYTLKITSVSSHWQATLSQERLSLKPNHTTNVTISVAPSMLPEYRYGQIILTAVSQNDPGVSDQLIIPLEILSADLTVTTLLCIDDDRKEQRSVGQGEFISFKAYVKNIGNQNATNVLVSFYLDKVDENNKIGQKNYTAIGRYQKYPSILWDTLCVSPGIHHIIAVVDPDDQIEEFSENNNQQSITLEIVATDPNQIQQSICITELYYHSRPTIKNEYIALYNPAKTRVALGEWYLTTTPWKPADDQTKIIFPSTAILPPQSTLFVTQNASAFYFETGFLPGFEYLSDSTKTIPQMDTRKTLTMSNSWGCIALKDAYNHTVDAVCYGQIQHICPGWDGPPIPLSGMGVRLKRNMKQAVPYDSDTSDDWNHGRIYRIGQSDFPLQTVGFFGEVTCFVSPDCSFEAIIREIRRANHSIYLNIYEFTSPLLLDELIDALNRNVSVFVYLEGSPIGGIDHREATILSHIVQRGGIIRLIVSDKSDRVYARYRFNHAKYLIIDNNTVIIESCNWVKTGVPKNPSFGNREWGIIIHNHTVAQLFLEIFFDDANPDRCDTYSFDMLNITIPNDFFLNRNSYQGSYTPRFDLCTVRGNITATPLFSPDTSEQAILDLISSAQQSIYIQQLYIYPNWTGQQSPFVTALLHQAAQGLDIRIILNCNPGFEDSYKDAWYLKRYLEPYGIQVKLLYTNWSYFSNMHNKGLIVDNHTVLISSVNWNENSVRNNREAGIILNNTEIAAFYLEVFLFDWSLEKPQLSPLAGTIFDYKSNILLVVIYSLTFGIIARDWRKRSWKL